MDKALEKKVINLVRDGIIFHSFTEKEMQEVEQHFDTSLPQLVDSATAMQHLHCDKHRLNRYLNQGYLKRVKFSHRKIMIDYDSLKHFMTYGI